MIFCLLPADRQMILIFHQLIFQKKSSGNIIPENRQTACTIYTGCAVICVFIYAYCQLLVAALTSGNFPAGLFHHLVGTALAQTDDQDISVGVTVLVNGDGTGCQRHILYSLHASHDIICLQIRSCCL